MPCGNASFCFQLLHGLIESMYDVGRRGITPFPVSFFHRFPLGIDVEGKRAGITFGRRHFFFLGDDETKSGNTLYTFVGTADEEIYTQTFDVDRNTAEAAHRIDDECDIFPFDYFGDFFDTVQQSGRRFAVHHRQVGNTGIFFQRLTGCLAGDQFGFVERNEYIVDVIIAGDFGHTFSISAVGENQQFVFRTYGSTDGRFHAVGSAALQQHIGVLVFVQTGDS